MRKPAHFALKLCCTCLGAASLLVAQETPPPAMASNAKPTYEVATIKPSLETERRAFFVDGLQLRTSATTLVDLMTFAYSVHSTQVTGAPAWMRSDRYDVVMQPSGPGRPSTAQMKSIMQQLITDRFQLKMHHARKEMEVYSILPSKHGVHLMRTTREETAINTATGGYAPGTMVAKNATVAEFANLMNRYMQLDWPVVDDTHIAGKFDYTLTWIPDKSESGGWAPARGGNDTATAPDLFAAMDQQLGLELKAVKEPVDVLVIDGVERPSAN